MSEPVSALNGLSKMGAVQVRDTGPVGMVTIRADLSSEDVAAALASSVSLSLPEVGQVSRTADVTCLWMSPDEIMLVMAYDAVGKTVSDLNRVLDGHHSMVVDVSDARTCLTLSGAASALRDTLAKLTPADVRENTLGVGTLRRTRLAQVPAAFWFQDNTTVQLICFRSVSEYVFGILSNAAKSGAEPNFF